jgi:hypothetical protein
MITPPLALALVEAFAQMFPGWMRTLVCASYAVLLAGLALNAFFSLKKTPYTMSVQPLGALMFLAYTVFWIFSSSFWKRAGNTARAKRLGKDAV